MPVPRHAEFSFRDLSPAAAFLDANRVECVVKPASGTFSKLEDIEGLLLAGPPADIVRDTVNYAKAGLDHIVYDLRFCYADWYEQVDLLGKEVLPAVRAQI